ncbi:hypothetical protein S40293_11301 [Stachybotrys chartarum IBT 40293]|nr:hypothetical protein S40293_11301 [Stachybotrys chartarum IBT 40293]
MRKQKSCEPCFCVFGSDEIFLDLTALDADSRTAATPASIFDHANGASSGTAGYGQPPSPMRREKAPAGPQLIYSTCTNDDKGPGWEPPYATAKLFRHQAFFSRGLRRTIGWHPPRHHEVAAAGLAGLHAWGTPDQ